MPRILLIKSEPTTAALCRKRFLEAGLVDGKDFTVATKAAEIEPLVDPAIPQLLMTGRIGSPEATYATIDRFRAKNPSLVVAKLSVSGILDEIECFDLVIDQGHGEDDYCKGIVVAVRAFDAGELRRPS